MSTYTDEDLERARKLMVEGHASWLAYYIATLVADVRRETREATIREGMAALKRAQNYHGMHQLEALLTPPSAPAAPKCRVCGLQVVVGVNWEHSFDNLDRHDFEPEEPGHG